MSVCSKDREHRMDRQTELTEAIALPLLLLRSVKILSPTQRQLQRRTCHSLRPFVDDDRSEDQTSLSARDAGAQSGVFTVPLFVV